MFQVQELTSQSLLLITKEATLFLSLETHLPQVLILLVLSGSKISQVSYSLKLTLFQGKRCVPGPGSYEPNVGMNKTGSYFVSKFMGSMCRTHYHFDRATLAGQKL